MATGIFAPTWRSLTIGIIALMSVSAFEAVATATAMPVVARELDALDAYTWAFNANVVAALLGMVVAGLWSDARGPRAPLMFGLGSFIVGSFIAGAATNFAVLVLGRAVQGVGGGMVIVGVYVVIARAYPAELRPRAFSALASAWVVPSLIGPLIAGWLADSVSWRWVFWLVPVIVVPALFAIASRLRSLDGGTSSPDRHRRIIAGTIAAAALVAFQAAVLLESPLGALGAAVAVAVLALASRPLLPAGTYRLARGLPTTVLMRGLLAGAYFTAEVFVPLALVQVRGVSTTLAGMALATGAVLWTVGSTVQARLNPMADRSRVVQAGAAIVAVAILSAPLALLDALPPWLIAGSWALAALGMGLSIPSISVQTMRLCAPQEQGRASSALQILDSIVVVVASATIGVIYAVAERAGTVSSATFTTIWVASAAVAGAAALIAPRMRPLAA